MRENRNAELEMGIVIGRTVAEKLIDRSAKVRVMSPGSGTVVFVIGHLVGAVADIADGYADLLANHDVSTRRAAGETVP